MTLKENEQWKYSNFWFQKHIMDPADYTTLCIKTHVEDREGPQSISHYKRLFLASLVDYVCPENVKQLAEKIHDQLHQNRKF